MIQLLRKKLSPHLINIPGWRTSRKIVVIESDDWGSIRLAGKDAFNSLRKAGLPVDECPYNSNDALESNKDLERLMDTLYRFKDKNGNPCIMTMNNIVANPDFDKIKESGFQTYYYEAFTDTLDQYPLHDKVLELYNEGIQNEIFRPQFHGREHVNIPFWMADLENGRKETLLAFNERMFSAHFIDEPSVKNKYMDSLNFRTVDSVSDQKSILISGLALFNQIWGYPSESFIAPAYIWHPEIESTLNENGVHYIQGLVNQMIPTEKDDYAFRIKYHYTGQKNKHGQYYLIRNVFFEPTIFPDQDNISEALKRIETAFKWGKPAIISTHRLNYIGWINPSNSSTNLKSLSNLISSILRKWPDAEFMSTDELGRILSKKKGT